jgi:hypothetical protein
MEQARSRGELRTNSFVRLRKPSPAGALEIRDLGDADGLLSNARHLNKAVSELLKSGVIPTEDGWGGWLGRYQTALRETASKTEERVKGSRDRRRDRTHDRER